MVANDNENPEQPFSNFPDAGDELSDLVEFLAMIQDGHPDIGANPHWREMVAEINERHAACCAASAPEPWMQGGLK